MQPTFDRTQEDLGNSVGLEHLNLTIPDQQPAIAFYIMGLGLTRDPYLVTGLVNMWVNVGRSQFHLPIKDAQVMRGHIGLVMPDLAALQKRLDMVKERLSNTKFGYSKRSEMMIDSKLQKSNFKRSRPTAAGLVCESRRRERAEQQENRAG